MAFDLDSGSTSNTGNTSGKKQAQGFINIYLPTKGGGKKKVGFLSLYDDNVDQKELRDWLEKDVGNMAIFNSKIIIEYNSAEKKDEHKFDLG